MARHVHGRHGQGWVTEETTKKSLSKHHSRRRAAAFQRSKQTDTRGRVVKAKRLRKIRQKAGVIAHSKGKVESRPDREKWRRQVAVQDLLGSFALEDLHPNQEERDLLRRYEAGEVSLADLKAKAGIE